MYTDRQSISDAFLQAQVDNGSCFEMFDEVASIQQFEFKPNIFFAHLQIYFEPSQIRNNSILLYQQNGVIYVESLSDSVHIYSC